MTEGQLATEPLPEESSPRQPGKWSGHPSVHQLPGQGEAELWTQITPSLLVMKPLQTPPWHRNPKTPPGWQWRDCKDPLCRLAGAVEPLGSSTRHCQVLSDPGAQHPVQLISQTQILSPALYTLILVPLTDQQMDPSAANLYFPCMPDFRTVQPHN